MINEIELVEQELHRAVHGLTDVRVALAKCETEIEKFYPIVILALENAKDILDKIKKIRGEDE